MLDDDPRSDRLLAARPDGSDVDSLGPSDTSDSGSDVQGERRMATDGDDPDELGALPVDGRSDSDSTGTGERGSATGDDDGDAADIRPDRIETLDADGMPIDDEDAEATASGRADGDVDVRSVEVAVNGDDDAALDDDSDARTP